MPRFLRPVLLGTAIAAMLFGLQGVVVLAGPADAHADVCGSVGGRRGHVSVSSCGSIADAVAPWVAPPSEYAPMPEDFQQPPPPPPPAPDVNVCASVGRRISVSGCI